MVSATSWRAVGSILSLVCRAECQSYDSWHIGCKLDKVENYLANESFPPYKAKAVEEADIVLFIQEVWLEPVARGRGIGLLAVDKLIRSVSAQASLLVLLQPGPVGPSSLCVEVDADEATERIAKHWTKIGFAPWSDSDESWLCLLSKPEGDRC